MCESRITQKAGVWERRFCNAPMCQADTLYVQRKDGDPGLWKVSEKPGQPEWLIASSVPVCPLCGGHLLTQANLDDGI